MTAYGEFSMAIDIGHRMKSWMIRTKHHVL